MTGDLYGDLRSAPPPLATPERVLAIGAHPDDIEFGAGATLAGWAGEGAHIVMLIMTDGSKGSWDPDRNPVDLAAARRNEQAAAAAALGAAEVIHLEHADGELEYTMDLRAEVCRQIRVARAEVVLSHDPWQPYQLHPDHRATGWAAVDGVVAARDPLFFPDQGVPAHRPQALLLWSAAAPDHAEDATAGLEAKIEALLCHSSQGTTTMGGAEQNEERRNEFAERVRSWGREAGSAVGLEMAERFKRLTP